VAVVFLGDPVYPNCISVGISEFIIDDPPISSGVPRWRIAVHPRECHPRIRSCTAEGKLFSTCIENQAAAGKSALGFADFGVVD